MNIDTSRIQRLSDVFAIFMIDALAKEKVPLIDGLTIIAMAVGNVITTTAESNSLSTKDITEAFKQALDDYNK